MKTRNIAIALAVAALATLPLVAQYATKIYLENGGDKQVVTSGGEIEVRSGATLDLQSGSTFNVAGVAFSANDYVPVTKAGQQSITATGAGNDVGLTAADDINLTATGDINQSSASSIVSTVTSGTDVGQIFHEADGSLIAVTDGTATSSIGVTAAGGVAVAGGLTLTVTAAPPFACAAGTEGGLYLDSDTHLLCVCNASAWVQVADGTTGCS